MNKVHIIIRICIILSPFFVPWWISLILGLSALFYYEKFYEIIVLGFIWDVVYHSQVTTFGLYGFSIASVVLFMLVRQIKKRLILY